MNAYDIFEEKVEELRKRGTPEHELYSRVHQQNPGLYQRYVDERQAGIRSQHEVKAETLRKSLERPPVASDQPENPAQAIVLDIAKSYLDNGKATSVLEAIDLVHTHYPKATAAASETAWRQAAGRR